jgi:hypothetical protein
MVMKPPKAAVTILKFVRTSVGMMANGWNGTTLLDS